MQQTQNTPSAEPAPGTLRENVFDEHGNTVAVAVVEADPEAEAPSGDEAAAENQAAAKKFRIGDREFATQEEALAYAQSHVSGLETEMQVADAYRQGLRDAQTSASSSAPGVTPPPPAARFDAEKLYTNPQEFLSEYAQQIKAETQAEINGQLSMKQQSDQIWREFTDRHPELADFRTEVEAFVGQNTDTVRGIIGTKGRPASYDFIATKLKSRFESYSSALKPKKALPNVNTTSAPRERGDSVTPPAPAKKLLSFNDQLRSIRKKGR